jgi:hypothetical protein
MPSSFIQIFFSTSTATSISNKMVYFKIDLENDNFSVWINNKFISTYKCKQETVFIKNEEEKNKAINCLYQFLEIIENRTDQLLVDDYIVGVDTHIKLIDEYLHGTYPFAFTLLSNMEPVILEFL